jgi:hypothetical protein
MTLILERKMRKPAIFRIAVLGLSAFILAGIIGLAVIAPVLAAVVFVVLATVGSIAIGKREGGWKGLVALAKDMIFGW